MQRNESEWEVVWEPPSFDLGGSFAYLLAKHPLFVYTCLQLQLLTTEAEWSRTHTWQHTHTHTCAILWGSGGMTKLSETHHHPPPPPRASLCPQVWHTHFQALSALQPHTPARTAGGVSCFSDEATSDQWAALRAIREHGGNSPPIALPGNQRCLREGLASLCLNEHQTKTLTTRWVTLVNVSFSVVYTLPLSAPSPPWIFFHSWLAHCFTFGQGMKKKKERRQKNKTVKVWELFLVPFSSSRSFYQY